MNFEIENNAVNRQPGMEKPGRARFALRKVRFYADKDADGAAGR
jgi:hypothetical protein